MIIDYPSKRLGVGKAFGELAILYNCKRTASIKVSVVIMIMITIAIMLLMKMVKTGLTIDHDTCRRWLTESCGRSREPFSSRSCSPPA